MALEMWNGSVWVTVTLGTRPIRVVNGATRAATITASEPSPHLVRPVVPGGRATGLEGEGVLDGQEVEQAALGHTGQVSPITGGEQVSRSGRWFSPGGGMPTGAIEGHRQVQSGCGTHRRNAPIFAQRLLHTSRSS